MSGNCCTCDKNRLTHLAFSISRPFGLYTLSPSPPQPYAYGSSIRALLMGVSYTPPEGEESWVPFEVHDRKLYVPRDHHISNMA
jgi:hypothetical protein